MDDWESDNNFDPTFPALSTDKSRGLCDDEDVEDNEDVKESWEDEDVPPIAKAPEPEPLVEKVVAESGDDSVTSNNVISVAETTNEKLADPVAEKLQRQRLVDEAEFKLRTELFAPRGDDKTLDNFIPKSESDFVRYAELVAHKLLPYEKSFHYINLLKNVVRLSTASMSAVNLKEVASSVTGIVNEKLKDEREANATKKKSAKKNQLHVDKSDVTAYDDALDDFNFM